MKGFATGLLQSPPDPRDYLYSRLVDTTEVLPRKFSRRDQMGPVRDQGKFGTCAAFTGAAIKDAQESLNYPRENIVTSPLYLYTKAKQIDQAPGIEGTTPRAIMQVLYNDGICREESMPYSLMSWPTLPNPSATAEAEAAKFRIGAYARLSIIDELKRAIFREGPIFAGLIVFENFFDLLPGGIVPLPGNYRSVGGHGMPSCGWDDDLKLFELKGSYGPRWGDNGGFCQVPYEYFSMRTMDTGINYWMESWSSVDVILPPSGAKEIVMWVGASTAWVDGQAVHLDQAPTIVPASGRTLVPLRFIAENMGYKVEWESASKRIRMIKPQ